MMPLKAIRHTAESRNPALAVSKSCHCQKDFVAIRSFGLQNTTSSATLSDLDLRHDLLYIANTSNNLCQYFTALDSNRPRAEQHGCHELALFAHLPQQLSVRATKYPRIVPPQAQVQPLAIRFCLPRLELRYRNENCCVRYHKSSRLYHGDFFAALGPHQNACSSFHETNEMHSSTPRQVVYHLTTPLREFSP